MTVTKLETETLFHLFRNEMEYKPIFVGMMYYMLEPGWKLEFDKSKKHAGLCYGHVKKLIKISTIYLKAESTTIEDVADTLLHEFAHAIAGTHNQHNEIWKYIALSIGSNGNEYCRCVFAPHKYVLTCPKGCVHLRHQLVKKTYTERKSGMATCPKHKNLPVIVTTTDTNNFINTFATRQDVVAAQRIISEFDRVNPPLKIFCD